VASRPAQRNMTPRLITALFHVNCLRRGCNDASLRHRLAADGIQASSLCSPDCFYTC
jgi:hypothetical protein